jgi:hypothetical protein
MSRVILCWLLFVALRPTDAAACECYGPANAREAYSASVIFQGRVTRITLRPQQWVIDDLYQDRAEVEFEVSRVWRGDVGQTAVITTGLGGGDCGYEFNVGWSYVVPDDPRRGVMSTGLCSGVELLWNDPPSLPLEDSWVPSQVIRSEARGGVFLSIYPRVAGLVMACLGMLLLLGQPRSDPEWQPWGST